MFCRFFGRYTEVFDKVWHPALLLKLKQIPHCDLYVLLQSYLRLTDHICFSESTTPIRKNMKFLSRFRPVYLSRFYILSMQYRCACL